MKKRHFYGLLYILGAIILTSLVPIVMIPIFQDYGLHSRDVVGYSLVMWFFSLVLTCGFGALIWVET